MVQSLKVPVNGNKRILKINNSWLDLLRTALLPIYKVIINDLF